MEQQKALDNKRIAKNTGFLYIRMFIMLIVGLYSARIVLQALGETDFGIYNLIGGIIVLLSFLNNSLTLATQRFLTFNLGQRNHVGVKNVFCMSMNLFLILSAFVLVAGETVGLWFVNTQLNIPAEKMVAANWVYQFSILAFIFNLLRIPYNATIIAYEEMSFFAYMGLIEAVLKLGIAFLLFVTTNGRLILYAGMYALFPLLINVAYYVFCRKKYRETSRYTSCWDRNIAKSMFTFSGWSFFGSLTNLFSQQGVNILINIFFGVIVNAAVGIANNVSSQVKMFVTNFQTAFQPQIVKTYAANDHVNFRKLVSQSVKFSFFLIYIISLPLILTTDSILAIWLTEIPEYTAIFCQLILGFMIIEAMSTPLWMAVHATGKIKNYEIIMSVCFFMNFPIVFIAFKLGMSVYWAWIIRIILNVITFYIRCAYLKHYLQFNLADFTKTVLLRILLVMALTIPLPLLVALHMETGLVKILCVGGVSLIVSVAAIYTAGFTQGERQFAKGLILKKLRKQPVTPAE